MYRPLTLYLEKRAGLLGSVARGLGSSALRSGSVGAGGGALVGVVNEHLSGNPDKHYLKAGLRGGVVGGALGVASHSVARRGLDAALLARSQGKSIGAGGAALGAAKSYGRSLGDFGKRQVHGFTGTMGGSLTAGMRREQDMLKLRHADALRRGAKGEAAKATAAIAERGKDIAKKTEALKAGVTSLPGVALQAIENPKQLGKDLWKHNIGAGGVAKGMAVLPAGMAAGDIAIHGDESATGGLNRKQKALKGVAQTAGGVLAGGMPFIPGMIAWDAAEKAVSPWTKPKNLAGTSR